MYVTVAPLSKNALNGSCAAVFVTLPLIVTTDPVESPPIPLCANVSWNCVVRLAVTEEFAEAVNDPDWVVRPAALPVPAVVLQRYCFVADVLAIAEL